MPDKENPEVEDRASDDSPESPDASGSRAKIRSGLNVYFQRSRINLGKRTIQRALRSSGFDGGEVQGHFVDVIERRPARLAEIIECLESSKSFDRNLGAALFRAWMVDPAGVKLHRLSLASVIRTEARRIERRTRRPGKPLSPYEAAIAQSAARLSRRHGPFYASYYFRFGEEFVEKAPTVGRLEAELHKRSAWLPEALTMLAGMHRMHDIASETGASWSPSLLKGYAFAGECRLRPEMTIFGHPLDIRKKARGKKTIEDNLQDKSMSPCIWYCAWNARASDGTPLVDVIANAKVDLAAYVADIRLLLARAAYVWETVALPEYRERCGPSPMEFPPLPFRARELDSADEERLRTLMSVKAGRPRTR